MKTISATPCLAVPAALAALAALATMTACSGKSAPVAPGTGAKPVPEYSARMFYETTTIFGSSFSHDESRLLITTDKTGIFNAYAQPLAGGEPTALTESTVDTTFGLSYFPHDDRILVSADQGGNELAHIYVIEPGGGRHDLTPGKNLKAMFMGWSGDKKSFYIATNERDAKAFDIYRYATDGYARELMFENPGVLMPGAISPDGRFVAASKRNSNADADIYLWDNRARVGDRAGGNDREPVLITQHQGNIAHVLQDFSPDSKRLYYTSDSRGEFAELWYYDLAGGEHKAELSASWDVAYVSFSESGKYRVIGINQDARTVLSVVETATGKELTLPELPDGEVTSVDFSPSETKMAFYVSSSRSPRNAYIWDLPDGAPRQLTTSLNPAIAAEHLVAGEVIRYRSFDGIEIPALLYKPHNASATSKVPAVVMVHGGPGGQSRLDYSADIQHLVNHGYAVLAVNNRGSSGYGKSFFHLDDRNHGDGDLGDCVQGRRYLESLSWVDGSRVAIMGGSYGGYMVLAALAFQPDAFNLGIDLFGVANWLRTLASIPPWWGSIRDMLYAEMGDPATDRERLRRISPLFHADNIKKPLLVVQGANDPRVLKVESDEIVAAVKNNGVPVEYVVFDDEGHGFTKRKNRIINAEAVVGFLRRHLN